MSLKITIHLFAKHYMFHDRVHYFDGHATVFQENCPRHNPDESRLGLGPIGDEEHEGNGAENRPRSLDRRGRHSRRVDALPALHTLDLGLPDR